MCDTCLHEPRVWRLACLTQGELSRGGSATSKNQILNPPADLHACPSSTCCAVHANPAHANGTTTMAGRRLGCALASNASALAACAVAVSAVQSSLTFLSCSNSEDGGGNSRRGNNRRKRERSEEEEEPVNPCAEFNTLKWRMSYASRK